MKSRWGQNLLASMGRQPASSAFLRAAGSASVRPSPGLASRSFNSVPPGMPGGALPAILPFSTRTWMVSISTSYSGVDPTARSSLKLAQPHRLRVAGLRRHLPQLLGLLEERHSHERILGGSGRPCASSSRAARAPTRRASPQAFARPSPRAPPAAGRPSLRRAEVRAAADLLYGQFRAGVGVTHPRSLSLSTVERPHLGNGSGGAGPPMKL